MGEVILLEVEGNTFRIRNKRDNFKTVLSVKITDPKQLEKLKELKGKYRIKVNREFRCDKCGKQNVYTIIPYQRMGQLGDICLCSGPDDPFNASIIKKGFAKVDGNGNVVLIYNKKI